MSKGLGSIRSDQRAATLPVDLSETWCVIPRTLICLRSLKGDIWVHEQRDLSESNRSSDRKLAVYFVSGELAYSELGGLALVC